LIRNILCVLFFCGQVGFAQNMDDEANTKTQKKSGSDQFNITAKLDVTGLINPIKTSTGIVSDFRINQKWSIEGTLGCYFHSSQSSPFKGESYLGLKTGIGFKHWINPVDVRSMYWGVFLGGNYIVNKNFQDINRQDQFTQITKVKRTILSSSADVRLGFQWYIGKQKRFIIDYFLGLGIFAYNVQVKKPIEGELWDEFQEFFNLELPEGNGLKLHGHLLGLNIGYVIK